MNGTTKYLVKFSSFSYLRPAETQRPDRIMGTRSQAGEFDTENQAKLALLTAVSEYSADLGYYSSFTIEPFTILDPDMEEAKRRLDSLVEFLNEGSNGAQALWDILTALRGPDIGGQHTKKYITLPIRQVVGLKPFYAGEKHVKFRHAAMRADPHVTMHFQSHISNAVQALENLGYVDSSWYKEE